MADWTQPFSAAYRFMRVSRATGNETGLVEGIRGGKLTINQDTQTFESADVDTLAMMDFGADLVRGYLDATFDDGSTESVCLGTWLINVPARDMNGEIDECSAYLDGRLSELQADSFDAPIVVPAGSNIIETARGIAEGAGLTVRAVASDATLGAPWYFGLDDDGETDGGSKLDAINALLRVAGYSSARTDPWGVVVMAPAQSVTDDPPVWRFEEGLTATFLDEGNDEHDKRDVCNVVLAVFETDEATTIGEAVDDDPDSEYSTVTLGRRKVAKYFYRDTATQAQANAKAAELLATNQSTIKRLTLTHVYSPARVGDVVAVSWPSKGIEGTYVVRTQDVSIGSAGCLTTSELRRFERGANA